MGCVSLPPSLLRLLGLCYQQSHCLGCCALLCLFPILNSFSSFLFGVFYLTKAILSLFPGNHIVHFLPEYSKNKEIDLVDDFIYAHLNPLNSWTSFCRLIWFANLWLVDLLVLKLSFLFRVSNVTGDGDEEMEMASLAFSQCCLFKSKASECPTISARVCKYLNRKVLGGNFFRQCFQTAWQQNDCVNCKVCPSGYINRTFFLLQMVWLFI